MISKQATIENRTGLHARPASRFVQKANKFEAEIYIKLEDREVNAKSIMGVMSLGAGKGSKITIKADGKDEDNAVNELAKFISELN